MPSNFNLLQSSNSSFIFLRANQCTWLPVSYQFCNFLVLAVGVGAVVAPSDHAISELVSHLNVE
jgi:hypothetical protein